MTGSPDSSQQSMPDPVCQCPGKNWYEWALSPSFSFFLSPFPSKSPSLSPFLFIFFLFLSLLFLQELQALDFLKGKGEGLIE